MSFLDSMWCGLHWTPWVQFSAPDFTVIPPLPGVYRVKPVDGQELVYIGQTGRNLRERLMTLRRHSMALEMPFNDPHTAAPCLWARRDAEQMEFACSAAPTKCSKKERLALECYLLWHYRLETQESTRCNFGRFHPHYRKSRNRSSQVRGGRLAEGEINPHGGESYPLRMRVGITCKSSFRYQDGSSGERKRLRLNSKGLTTVLSTEMVCAKVAQEQPRLPDGRRLIFRLQGTGILHLDAQEQAVL